MRFARLLPIVIGCCIVLNSPGKELFLQLNGSAFPGQFLASQPVFRYASSLSGLTVKIMKLLGGEDPSGIALPANPTKTDDAATKSKTDPSSDFSLIQKKLTVAFSWDQGRHEVFALAAQCRFGGGCVLPARDAGPGQDSWPPGLSLLLIALLFIVLPRSGISEAMPVSCRTP